MGGERAARSRAIVLFSGGLDSTTLLALAEADGHDVYALSFDYGQRHNAELAAAKSIASASSVVEHRTIGIDLGGIGGSALTDAAIEVPEAPTTGIPVTYVPARNTVFLSLAMGWAEVIDATAIYIGVNAIDYSGYPDCRPEFIDAFRALTAVATKAGVEGNPVEIIAPLLHMTKADIVTKGVALGVDYAATVSCYQATPDGAACGRCDACRLRAEGFAAAGLPDPTRYA
ncbi:MAG: 7-cyano-7-deazaguanine synthase QueC [Pseudomonadota bacterium]